MGHRRDWRPGAFARRCGRPASSAAPRCTAQEAALVSSPRPCREALTSIRRQLTARTIDEYADLSQRNSPELLLDLMGFGRPAGPFEQFRADHLHSSFGPSRDGDRGGHLSRGKCCCTTHHNLRHPCTPANAVAPSHVVLHDRPVPRMGSPRDRLARVGRRRASAPR
jgi:hypothetical protein